MCGISQGRWGAVETFNFKSTSWETITAIATVLEAQPDDICPPELRKTHLHLERTAYREASAAQLIVDQERARLTYEPDAISQSSPAVQEAMCDAINQSLRTLAYREREIIKMRYGIGNSYGDGYTYTYDEIGKIFKVTRERVRQVEAKAIRKLQHPVRARKLEGFLENLEPTRKEKT